MWWKLTLLTLVTLLLVIAVQPIKTHAVRFDVPPGGQVPHAPRQNLLDILSAMYVTPTSLLMTAIIVGIAAFFAFRIVRG